MRLNDSQIRRIIRHVCDKTGFSELSGSIGFYFVDNGDRTSAVTCSHNGYTYKPTIKYYDNIFSKLNQEKQIIAVLESACEAVNEYRVKQKRQKPKKYAVRRMLKQCLQKESTDV
jgi:hypothetical protein